MNGGRMTSTFRAINRIEAAYCSTLPPFIAPLASAHAFPTISRIGEGVVLVRSSSKSVRDFIGPNYIAEVWRKVEGR